MTMAGTHSQRTDWKKEQLRQEAQRYIAHHPGGDLTHTPLAHRFALESYPPVRRPAPTHRMKHVHRKQEGGGDTLISSIF